MSMSTYVHGIKPRDAKWKRMKAAHDACEAAGASIPDEINKFFGYEEPDAAGVIVNLEKICVTEDHGNGEDRWEVDLSKLPKDITIIRFSNSY